MRSLRLLRSELRFQQLAYWRNPIAAFFSLLVPVLFLVILGYANESGKVLDGLPYDQYFVPGILTFGIVASTYTTLAMTLTTQREAGILKRLRTSPLPAWVYFGGIVLNSLVVCAVLTAATLGLGVGLFSITAPRHVGALAVTLVVAIVCFSFLGIAVSALVPNADAAPAIVNALYLPLVFISGSFYPIVSDSVIGRIAAVFPMRPFVVLTVAAFDPRLSSPSPSGGDLAVIAIWGLAALCFSLRRFRWTPERR